MKIVPLYEHAKSMKNKKNKPKQERSQAILSANTCKTKVLKYPLTDSFAYVSS